MMIVMLHARIVEVHVNVVRRLSETFCCAMDASNYNR